MATEQTPLESDLREPRRHSREFKTLLWLGGWGGARGNRADRIGYRKPDQGRRRSPAPDLCHH